MAALTVEGSVNPARGGGVLAGAAPDLMQSALNPAGPAAQDIVALTTELVIGAGLILLAVMALVAYGSLRDSAPVSTGLWVAGGGFVFPVVVLSALFLYSTPMTDALMAPAPPEALRIEVDGRQWWWEVRYPSRAGRSVVGANELHIPTGAAIEVIVTSPDVIHSFWVPSLGGKVDMVPGRANRLTLRADRAGVYRGQCAEYCGIQHAQMALLLVAETPEAFAAWLRAEATSASPPSTPEATRGLEAFLAQGCGGCHTIRGTAALGQLGPDLTHLASRRTLAAGSLGNDARAIRAWLTAGSALKPGNRMPSYAHLDAATLDAITAYLAALR
jgi:cytochrome c oxidase subunit 2